MSDNRVIGKEGKLPWHFSEDLKRFKQLTMANTVLMGRKTFQSLGEKPLSGRENFVLSRSILKDSDGKGIKFNFINCSFFDSLEKAFNTVKTEKAFIIGGAEIFKQTMNRIDGIFLTQIHGIYEGDVFYPEIPEGVFEIKKRERSAEEPKLEFIDYERKKQKRSDPGSDLF